VRTFAALFRALVTGYARANVLRAIVTLIAVALGVAASYAIDIANDTAVASFSKSVDVIANHVNLQVFGAGRGFDERALLRVQRLPGVRSANPIVEGEIGLGVHPGDPQSGEIVRVMGIDITRAALPNGVDAAQAEANFDPHRFIDDNGIFVSHRIALRYHAPAGALLSAYAGPRLVHLHVMGVIPPNTVGVDSSVAFVDIATAQELFGKVGLLDRIDIVADPTRLDSIRAAIARVIPPGSRVLAPHTRLDEIKRMLASFQMNLSALADVALLVGMYLIYNAVAISVVQRKSEIGTLRALGARRREIFATFVAEGALYGAIGALLGLALGFVLARFAVQTVQLTVSTLYVASHADGLVVTPFATVKALSVGIGLAMLSAALPARDAAATAPARAMRTGAGAEHRVPGLGRASAALGVFALVLAAGLARLPAVGDGVPLFGYAAGILLIAGASLCTPIVLAAAAVAVRAIRGNASTTIAAGFLRGSPRRFSVAIASLAVAVGMMVAIAILVGSFRATIVAWTHDTLGADLYIKAPGTVDAGFQGYFQPEVPRLVASVPGVAAVDTFRGFDVPFRGAFAQLGTTDVRSLVTRNALRFLGHPDVGALVRSMYDRNVVAVSEPFSTRFGLVPGDAFTLDTPSGRTRFRIAAVYNDYSTSGGTFMMDRATFARLYHDDTVDSIAVYAKPGVNLADLRTAIVRKLEPLRIDINTNREIRAYAIAIFDRTFAITNALYGISLTIAILGVVSTLFALVLERREEIALLRYIGLTRAGVRRTVLVQAAVVGVLAAAIGIGLGILLAADLIYVINRQSFGWLIEWKSPGWFYLQAAGMVIVAALVAAIYPARVASRIEMSQVLRAE